VERQFLVVVNESSLEACGNIFKPDFIKFVEVGSANIANQDGFCLLTTPKAPIEKPVEKPSEKESGIA
jgi:hypothetical protein